MVKVDFDTKKYRLYEYDNVTEEYTIEVYDVDLYELYYDDYWFGKTVPNTRPINTPQPIDTIVDSTHIMSVTYNKPSGINDTPQPLPIKYLTNDWNNYYQFNTNEIFNINNTNGWIIGNTFKYYFNDNMVSLRDTLGFQPNDLFKIDNNVVQTNNFTKLIDTIKISNTGTNDPFIIKNITLDNIIISNDNSETYSPLNFKEAAPQYYLVIHATPSRPRGESPFTYKIMIGNDVDNVLENIDQNWKSKLGQQIVVPQHNSNSILNDIVSVLNDINDFLNNFENGATSNESYIVYDVNNLPQNLPESEIDLINNLPLIKLVSNTKSEYYNTTGTTNNKLFIVNNDITNKKNALTESYKYYSDQYFAPQNYIYKTYVDSYSRILNDYYNLNNNYEINNRSYYFNQEFGEDYYILYSYSLVVVNGNVNYVYNYSDVYTLNDLKSALNLNNNGLGSTIINYGSTTANSWEKYLNVTPGTSQYSIIKYINLSTNGIYWLQKIIDKYGPLVPKSIEDKLFYYYMDQQILDDGADTTKLSKYLSKEIEAFDHYNLTENQIQDLEKAISTKDNVNLYINDYVFQQNNFNLRDLMFGLTATADASNNLIIKPGESLGIDLNLHIGQYSAFFTYDVEEDLYIKSNLTITIEDFYKNIKTIPISINYKFSTSLTS
jgi:hypothetical protein